MINAYVYQAWNFMFLIVEGRKILSLELPDREENCPSQLRVNAEKSRTSLTGITCEC